MTSFSFRFDFDNETAAMLFPMLQRAAALAERLQKSGAKNDTEMITAAYQLTFNRPPTETENSPWTYLQNEMVRCWPSITS